MPLMQIYDSTIHEDRGSNKKIESTKSATALDTLAQGGTKLEKAQESPILKRAKRKYIGQALAVKLASVPGSSLTGAYWRTFHCGNVIHQKDQTFTSRYCNGRWCPVCNAIRTRNLIAGYGPPLAALQSSYFVTLTIPNVVESDLPAALDGMLQTFKGIAQKFKKQHQRRTSDSQLVGIRKTEVTYNCDRNDYHPHFHCIIEGKHMAEGLVTEWLARYPKSNRQAQHITPVTDGAVKELFKYVTKVVSKIQGETKVTPTKALDVIFTSMKNKQIFKAFGIRKLPEVSEDIDGIQSQEYDLEPAEYAMWVYVTKAHDWVDTESGEVLSGYVPSKAQQSVIDKINLEA